MSLRLGPRARRALGASAALAAGFIAVRVVYRVLFHGADGDGVVLLALPVWPLPPPFAHVEVFGPVTTGGLVDAVAGALPIALTILAFGALNALVDMPRLIARGARSGPLQGLARAVSIAWAALPALADAVRSARFAQRLRGERGGVRLLAPVLEHTLERATAVAAALELRGYAGRGLDGDCARPASLHAAVLGFAGREEGAVTAAEIALLPGTLTVLTGATGSGKTTLLRALSGLHSHVDGGWLAGSVRVVGHDRPTTMPRDLSRRVGVVLQHPRQAFAATRVADEIGLALELRGVAPVIVAERARAVAERVGVAALLERELRGLSAGEATLVAIAAAIVEDPILLLVDEPLADLDRRARSRIVALLGALAHEAGVCVLVAEHRADEFAAVADGQLTVAQGRVTTGAGALAAAPFRAGAARNASASRHPASPGAEAHRGAGSGATGRAAVLTATGLTVRHGARVAVDAASVTLAAGEVVALRGPNGAGKSSLLVALATGEHDNAVALVPDDSDALFVRDSVAAECRRVDRRRHLAAGATAARLGALLGLEASERAAMLRRHPRDLSAGERRTLAIVVQSAAEPRVLLLDEPTRGLDPQARELVAHAILAQAATGTAVLFATHDAAFATLADRVIGMDAGVLTPAAAAAPLDGLEAGFTPAPRAAIAHPGGDVPAPSETPAPTRQPERRARWRTPALIAANLVALSAFLWPLIALATPRQAQAAVPSIALSLAPLAVVLVLAALDASVRSAHTLALLAVLAAIDAAIRIASTGVGGVEALFVLLILAGRAFGPRFGLLLGAASLALSALMWGGVGPWLPFQMFACGWVGAGAGLLPRRVRGAAEVAMLAAYGVVASYLFGLVMNMWFWPFAVGANTSISYLPGGSIGENLGRFLVYSLLTSTAGWDTLRALTSVIGLALVGRALLRSLRRAKPVVPSAAPIARATVDA